MSEDQWGEYLRAKEPGVREKAYAWKTAIGLQKVDGLTPTEYLELFFRNLLLGESNALQSRYLIVGGWKGPDAPTSNPKSNGVTPTSNGVPPTSNAATPTSKNGGNWALSQAVRRLVRPRNVTV